MFSGKVHDHGPGLILLRNFNCFEIHGINGTLAGSSRGKASRMPVAGVIEYPKKNRIQRTRPPMPTPRCRSSDAGAFHFLSDLVFPQIHVDQPQLGSVSNQFHGAVKIEFFHDIGPMVFHGLGADA